MLVLRNTNLSCTQWVPLVKGIIDAIDVEERYTGEL